MAFFRNIGLGAILSFEAGGAISNIRAASSAFGTLEEAALKASSNISRITGSIKEIGRKASIAGALIGGGIATGAGIAIHEAMGLESSLANLNAVLGEESPVSVSKLTSQLQALEEQVGIDAATLARDLRQVITSGVEAGESVKFLGTATKLARAGLTDTSTAIDALTAVISGYGLKAGDAAQVADKFFTASRMGAGPMEMLTGSLKQVITTASGLGISFDEVLATQTALASATKSPVRAAGALRAIIEAVANATPELRAEAAKMGIDFSLSALKAKGLAGFLQDLRTATGGSEQAMIKLFGAGQDLGAVLSLTGNIGTKFQTALTNIRGASGETDKAFGKATATTAFAMDKMKIAFKSALEAIGFTLLPYVVKGMNLLIPVIKQAGEFLSQVLKAISAIASRRFTPRDLMRFSPLIQEIARGVVLFRDIAISAFEKIRAFLSPFIEAFRESSSESRIGFTSIAVSAGLALVALGPVAMAFNFLSSTIGPFISLGWNLLALTGRIVWAFASVGFQAVLFGAQILAQVIPPILGFSWSILQAIGRLAIFGGHLLAHGVWKIILLNQTMAGAILSIQSFATSLVAQGIPSLKGFALSILGAISRLATFAGALIVQGVQALISFAGSLIVSTAASIGFTGGLFAAAAAAWAFLAPLLPIILAIGAVVAAGYGIYSLVKNWDAVTEAVTTLWSEIKIGAEQVWEWVTTPFKRAFDFVKGLINEVKESFLFKGFAKLMGWEMALVKAPVPGAVEVAAKSPVAISPTAVATGMAVPEIKSAGIEKEIAMMKPAIPTPIINLPEASRGVERIVIENRFLVDGRELASAIKRNEIEIGERSGARLSPYKKRQMIQYGAIPATP